MSRKNPLTFIVNLLTMLADNRQEETMETVLLIAGSVMAVGLAAWLIRSGSRQQRVVGKRRPNLIKDLISDGIKHGEIPWAPGLKISIAALWDTTGGRIPHSIILDACKEECQKIGEATTQKGGLPDPTKQSAAESAIQWAIRKSLRKDRAFRHVELCRFGLLALRWVADNKPPRRSMPMSQLQLEQVRSPATRASAILELAAEPASSEEISHESHPTSRMSGTEINALLAHGGDAPSKTAATTAAKKLDVNGKYTHPLRGAIRITEQVWIQVSGTLEVTGGDLRQQFWLEGQAYTLQKLIDRLCDALQGRIVRLAARAKAGEDISQMRDDLRIEALTWLNTELQTGKAVPHAQCTDIFELVVGYDEGRLAQIPIGLKGTRAVSVVPPPKNK